MSRKSTKPSDQRHQEPPENTHKNIPEDPNTLEQAADELVDESTSEKVNGDENNESSIGVYGDDCMDAGDRATQDAKADDSREGLMEKLVVAHSQIDELKDGYIRAKAEMENIRRRSQNEMISARKYAIEGFAQELLSVVDSLDQATRVEMDKPNGEAAINMKENMKQGLELTLKQFDKVMEKFGVIAVEAEPGVKFNPEVHQAISVVASDEVEPEHIVNVMQKGFSLKDRLLRPAMVVIAKSSEKE
ncbi:nucleotide exchange factor GrpE [Candidatus Spongiihabitans sp.]|uniref:nucleotide exchange factor GrpE n=1 Tax=Candidatus Spongiihabitans sp. TaxID=3101308 RepID=UPI003C7060B0